MSEPIYVWAARQVEAEGGFLFTPSQVEQLRTVEDPLRYIYNCGYTEGSKS